MNPSLIRPLVLGARAALFAAAVVVLTACAGFGGAPSPARVADGVFVNAAGMTLYTIDRDTAGSGKSVCNGPCAVNWPPLLAAADARASGDWSVITRDDGQRQWAYKGKPLYGWAKDSKPGDRTGDGFNNVWRLARP
jgi:predicted lipoprotein with Yx(FWY)xxD motif